MLYWIYIDHPKISESTCTIHSNITYIRDLGDGFYIECFKSMKYHHLFASICSPYHLFYTVRFAMCIPFTDHIAPPRSPIAPRDMRYDIRDISFTFVAIGQYMDLHLNIVHTREIWNRFIDFFTVIWWCMENTFQQYFLFYIFLLG